MDNGLNNYLTKISSALLFKKGGLARINIDRSLRIIKRNLVEYFGNEVKNVTIFGSYKRDTILQRYFDEYSDVDIMVEFDTNTYKKLRPESYRSKLKRFAEDKYPSAISSKDYPCIVIELNHIKFDLVPSIFDKGLFYDSIEIPGKDGGWIETNPSKFNEKLTNANRRYQFIVKPIVRLLKYWNASNSYPYSSFNLENAIAGMNFSNDNLIRGFLYAIDSLPTYGYPNSVREKVMRLKHDGKTISQLLKAQNIPQAKAALNNLFPFFAG